MDLVIFSFICFVFYCTYTWIIPRFFAWFLKRKYNINLRVGHISVLNFIVQDVSISTNSFTVRIEECSVQSSLLHREIPKLLSIMLRDVQVNIPVLSVKYKYCSNKVLDFCNTKIPFFIISVIQYLSINIQNLNLCILGIGWLGNGNIDSLSFDTNIVYGACTLHGTTTIVNGTMKLFRDASVITRLAQINFAGTIEGTLKVQGELSFEKLFIGIAQAEGFGNVSILEFLKYRKSLASKTFNCALSKKYVSDVLTRFTSVLPKNLIVKLDSSSLIIRREDGFHLGLKCTMKSLQINAKFQPIGPQLYLTFIVDEISVHRNHPVLLLQSLSIGSMVEKNIVKSAVQLNNLSMTYIYKDWESIWTTDIKEILKFYITTLKNSIAWLKISTVIKLYESSLSIQLAEVEETCFSVTYVKFCIDRLTDRTDKSNIKLTLESLFCAFNGINASTSNTIHKWGNPLSIGSLHVTASKNNLKIVIDALKIEWSLEFAQFLKCGLLCYNEQKKSRNLRTSTFSDQTRQLNLKISNCILFFITRGKVAIMVHLSSVTLKQNTKRFVGRAKGVRAIMMDKNEPIVYLHEEELTDPFLTVRKCKTDITSSTINVNLGNDMKLVWSYSLQMCLLVLWIESSDFRSMAFQKKVDSVIDDNPLNVLYNGRIFLIIDNWFLRSLLPQISLELPFDNFKWSDLWAVLCRRLGIRDLFPFSIVDGSTDFSIEK